mgnify:CR=1 FL=1
MFRRLKKTDAWYNLKIYGSLIQRYKWLFATCMLVILAIEALRVVDKFLFKIIIDEGTIFTDGKLIVENFFSVLFFVALIFIVATILRAIGDWWRLSLMNRLEADMIFDIKKRFFNHIIHLSHNFHTTHKTGSLIARLLRGANAVEKMTDVLLFNIFPLVFQFGVVFFSLLYIHWIPAAIIAITSICFIAYSVVVQRQYHEYQSYANKVEDQEKGYISDVFTNIDAIKYFGKENTMMANFKKLSWLTRNAFEQSWNFFRWLDSGQTIIVGVSTFFLLYFSIVELIAGRLSIGTVVFIYTLYGNILQPLYGFVHGLRNAYSSMADFEGLFTYAKIENDIKDTSSAKRLRIKEGKIEFKNVWFRYHQRFVLSDVNLVIRPNEKVALVGHSGSGKSTLVKLLYRFYDVTKGNILIDGTSVNDVQQESLRGELSVVPQECILFDETIYNNVAFSNPHAGKEAVWKAIQFAQLDKLIKVLPKKENTVVGERGVKLSGGEKQRVSIARALLANKKILVLDEATSSLDSKTEHNIQESLKKLMQGRTVVIIAHRLSTIMNADNIVVMAKGKIVQVGSHQQLIKQPGVYKQLWDLQKGGYIK